MPAREGRTGHEPLTLAGVVDLILSLLLVGIAGASFFLPPQLSSVSTVLLLPFFIFVPGYLITSALFPRASDSIGDPGSESPLLKGSTDASGPDPAERIAYSVGLTFATVGAIAGLSGYFTGGIDLITVMTGIALLSIIAGLVAAIRRSNTDKRSRFSAAPAEFLGEGGLRGLAASRGQLSRSTDRVLDAFVVIAFLLAVSGLVFGLSGAGVDDNSTRLFLLNETPDGQLTADEYPTEMAVDETERLVLGIGNKENSDQTYTVLVKLQRVDTSGTETVVREQAALDRFRVEVATNTTERRQYDFSPTFVGEELRLVFLLYRGTPPDSPSVENAYREVHLIINVTEPTASVKPSQLPPAVQDRAGESVHP